MRRAGRSLADAFGFLTIAPVPSRPGAPSRGGTWAFPVVGLAIGTLLFATMSLPLPPSPRAALVLAVWVLATAGLHEDAWADAADGAFAVAPRERRLEILRDPRIGAHGLTATAVLLLLRYAALVEVPHAAVLAAPVVGRWAMVVATVPFPPARETGLGAWFAAAARPWGASVAAGAALAVVAILAGVGAVVAAAAVGAGAGWAIGRFLSGRFGGLTGDGYGAVGTGAEVAALWSFLPLTS